MRMNERVSEISSVSFRARYSEVDFSISGAFIVGNDSPLAVRNHKKSRAVDNSSCNFSSVHTEIVTEEYVKRSK